MRDEVADGWKISQVEVLVGLPRRDIQRACYEGAGGLGIVKPRNTTWGWRVYEVPDVAKLFLLAQGRRQGKTLDEVRDELAEGLLSKLFADLARVRACGQDSSSNEAKEICAASVHAVSERCALRAADAGMLLARAMNASGMGLTCELWLGPATWTYANAALEASRIDMHARGFSTEDAIESRE